MSSHAIINTLNAARQITIAKIESIDEALFHVQPPQFNNTISWNIGHMITAMDGLVFGRATQTSKLPAEFTSLYKGGTKPSDWTVTPPSKSELLALLKQQLADLIEAFGDKADQPLPASFQIRGFTFETIGDAIGFATFHEGQHIAIVSDLQKVIQSQ